MMKMIRALAGALLSSALILNVAHAATGSSDESSSYDVVVYGATPGGITAAIAAARNGRSVVVVEPLGLVGGMLSGGMGFSDSWLMRRETLGGLFMEFRQRVADDYERRGVKLPYEVSTTDRSPWTSEPHVNERIFEEMLREAKVHVKLNSRLVDVQRSGATITALRTHSGERLRAKVFIDASYEGDLLAAAGVKYRVGREGRYELGESLAGVRYTQAPFTKLSALNEQNEPLPLVTDTAMPPQGQGDRKVQAYNFRVCVTDIPSNRVPFGKPAGYDASRYELFRRMYRVVPDYGISGGESTAIGEDGLPFAMLRLPRGKFDANDHVNVSPATLSLGLVGASWDYPEADHEKRQAIWADHRGYTEGLLYFLKTDAAVPERVRKRMQQLGYCKDEFVRFGHFPPVLYVREGRRMIGEYFMTQADIAKGKQQPDAIGIGSFNVDSHAVQRTLVDGGGFMTEGAFGAPGVAGPYQVPYRSILPKAAECGNLLVPVALSASHVAFSSLRVEPTWMVLGQSAGIAADLALEQGVPVHEVDVPELQKRLIAQRQVLALPK